MKARAPFWILALTLAFAAAGLGWVLRARGGTGELYPRYSSLRADPLGTRALYDALAVAGLEVSRNVRSLAGVRPAQPRTWLLIGFSDAAGERLSSGTYEGIMGELRQGGRVVIALRGAKPAAEKPAGGDEPAGREPAKKAPEKKTDRKPSKEPAEREGKSRRPPPRVDAWERWGVRIERATGEGGGRARVADEAPEGLRDLADVTWLSAAHLVPAGSAGWRPVLVVEGRTVLAERAVGRGRLVLATDSYFLSNEALATERRTPLLAWTIGGLRQVVFDETHLGVVAEPGMAALARRYGLAPAAVLLLVLALAYVWRVAAPFGTQLPPVDLVALRYHPVAGLTSLLRRTLNRDQAWETCLAEWRRTATPEALRRADAVLAVTSPPGDLVSRYNALRAGLGSSAPARSKAPAPGPRLEST